MALEQGWEALGYVATMGLRQFRRHRSLQSPKQPRLALRIKADKSRLFIPPAEMLAVGFVDEVQPAVVLV